MKFTLLLQPSHTNTFFISELNAVIITFPDPPSELLSTFFRIMDLPSVEKVFHQFSNNSTNRITEMNYLRALEALGISARRARPFAELDVDQEGGLDLDEFVRTVRYPSNLEMFFSTLPLAKMLVWCIESVKGRDESADPDPVRSMVSTLSQADIDKIACEFHGGLNRLLADKTREMQHCYAEMDKKSADGSDGSNSKYTFEFSAGSAVDFHAGLADRVGEQLLSEILDGL